MSIDDGKYSAKRAVSKATNPPCLATHRIPPCQVEAMFDEIDAMSQAEREAHLASLTKADLWGMIEVLTDMLFGEVTRERD
jgi:hypothetical protein